MKTLYLHIGMPKTATSSIQKFLSHNRAALRQNGYCYPPPLFQFPRVSVVRNAHFLIARVEKADGTRDYETENAYFSDGMKQIEDYFLTCDRIVLSDESIWFYSSYVHKRFFKKLADYAAKKEWQVKVIVYMRRQDEFLMSRWNQSVKQNTSDAAVMSFEEFLSIYKEKQRKILEYGKKLDQIAAALGKENLIVRRFDRAEWVDGSIVHDFVQQIGLTLNEDFDELQEPVNLGLGKNETELKRIINQDESFSPQEIQRLGNILRDVSKKGHPKEWALLSKTETQKLLDAYQKENGHAAQEYLADGKPLFSDKIKDLPKWTPQNEQMLETLVQFFTTALVEQQREQEQLRVELIDTQEQLKRVQVQMKKEQQQMKNFRNDHFSKLEKENKKIQKELTKQAAELKKVKWEFHMFRDKVKHPLRTLFRKLFRIK